MPRTTDRTPAARPTGRRPRLRGAARLLGALLVAACAPSVSAFSLGAPICEVDSLPLLEMSPTLADPAPSGWRLDLAQDAYMPARPLRVRVANSDPDRRARGVLLWAKTGPFSGAGQFLVDTDLFQYVPAPADCGLWAITHTSAEPKPLQDLAFWWLPPDSGTVLMRAFVIEECGAESGGCRDQQALTPLRVLVPKLFFDGFEPTPD